MENNEITRTNASTGVSSYRVSNQTAATADYQVSEKTALLFDCIRQGSDFYGQVLAAVAAYWGDQQADKVAAEFTDKWHEMEKELERLAMEVITDNLFTIGNTQI